MNITIRLTKVEYEMPKDLQRIGNRYMKIMGEGSKEKFIVTIFRHPDLSCLHKTIYFSCHHPIQNHIDLKVSRKMQSIVG